MAAELVKVERAAARDSFEPELAGVVAVQIDDGAELKIGNSKEFFFPLIK
jgi:hypothetical protein